MSEATAPAPAPAVEPSPHATTRDAVGTEKVRPGLSFYVYEWPVRLWHWITALLVFGLAATGYLIASPLPSNFGDTSHTFVMGTVRELHFYGAWLLAILFLWRGYWAIAGGKHARLIYYLPLWKKSWWKELWSVVRWYLFIDRHPPRWVGHNPLARASMFLMFTLGSTFMVISGFALYAEQLGTDSWLYRLFGWAFTVAGSSFTLRSWHHLGMYLLLLFSVIHIYAAIRDDVTGRVSTISSMVNGWRSFRGMK